MAAMAARARCRSACAHAFSSAEINLGMSSQKQPRIGWLAGTCCLVVLTCIIRGARTCCAPLSAHCAAAHSNRRNPDVRGALAIVAAYGLAATIGLAADSATDWAAVGHDPGGMKYSPLTQITAANVTRLKQAWTYDLGVPATGYTATPIVISNLMYLPVRTTIVAVKADAGTELWKFDLKTIPA